MTIADLLAWGKDLTLTGLLFLIIYGGHRRFWVFGWVHEEAVERAEDNRRSADRATSMLEALLQHTEEHWMAVHGQHSPHGPHAIGPMGFGHDPNRGG